MTGLQYAMALLAMLFFTSIGGAQAAPVILDKDAERITLTEHLRFLRDPEGRLDYADAIARLSEFQHADSKQLITGFNAGIYWLSITLQLPKKYHLSPPIENRWLGVGTAKTQRVTLYIGQGDTFKTQQSGRIVAVTARPLETLEPVFPLEMVPGEPLKLLLRVETRGTTNMVTTLWKPEAYRHAEGKTQMELTAIFGGMLTTAALALIVFIALRENQYLWLGLNMLAMASLEATRSNFFSTYLWPDALAQPAQWLVLFATLGVFSLSKVITLVLALAENMPRVDRLFCWLRWGGVAAALLSLANYGQGVRALALIATTQLLVILVLCLLVWNQQWVARYVLLAFALALLTETARQLANLGLLPWVDAMEFSTLFFLMASPIILLGMIAKTRNLTQRVYIAEQLQQAKSDFLARVSHELRSPLNTILGFNRMLARHSPRLSLADGTNGIEKSVLRLLRLIDELLDDARTAAGKLTIRPTPFNLKIWLDEIVEGNRFAFYEKGNVLEYSFEGELNITIEADAERLRQVLENLLTNANRHTNHGHIVLACQASRQENLLRLDFVVADTGEGIHANRLESIFVPFERLPSNQREQGKGFGLGLSICRELLRQMGGDISAESKPGKGSRFEFSLRFRIVDQPHPSEFPRHQSKNNDSPRVLIVDDDPIHLDLLTEILEESGIMVTTSCNGGEAITQLNQSDWDLVLTDQMMPGIDGWGVLRHVRETNPKLPVILISAVPLCRPYQLPHEFDFEFMLTKPINTDQIIATAWHQILKPRTGDATLEWKTLARLANEGDVTAIEEWVANARSNRPEESRCIGWIETQLYQLNMSILERFAHQALMRND